MRAWCGCRFHTLLVRAGAVEQFGRELRLIHSPPPTSTAPKERARKEQKTALSALEEAVANAIDGHDDHTRSFVKKRISQLRAAGSRHVLEGKNFYGKKPLEEEDAIWLQRLL